MKAIIAVNNLGFIGKGNTLLWKNKKDLQHFKELTLDQVLLVGYNTNSELNFFEFLLTNVCAFECDIFNHLLKSSNLNNFFFDILCFTMYT